MSATAKRSGSKSAFGELYIGGEWETNGRKLFFPPDFHIPDTPTAYQRQRSKLLSFIAKGPQKRTCT